ncbi:flagellar brake protein [Balneatrix alpica]|uniref:Flagellar brake protein n=1 Tax=Balneatrix alpica TaxID=75684 RepID=A0ABV5Z6L5_9GAMM|nr:flagellar brake protein [Balneatrix alpica]
MKKEQEQPGQVRLEELGLHIGDPLYIETLSPVTRYVVRLIGYISGQSMLVTAPLSQGRAIMLKEGKPLKVKLLADNKVCGFSTQVLKPCLTPFNYLHLAFPKELDVLEYRKATRINLRLIVSLDEIVEHSMPGRWPRPAICTDISTTGARISSNEPLAEIGQSLYMTARLSIAGVEQVVRVPLLIRNRTLEEDEGGQVIYHHGTEFDGELDEETKVTVTGFVYEQMLKGKR